MALKEDEALKEEDDEDEALEEKEKEDEEAALEEDEALGNSTSMAARL